MANCCTWGKGPGEIHGYQVDPLWKHVVTARAKKDNNLWQVSSDAQRQEMYRKAQLDTTEDVIEDAKDNNNGPYTWHNLTQEERDHLIDFAWQEIRGDYTREHGYPR